MSRRWRASTGLGLAAGLMVWACANAGRAPDTVVMASGADLESANPLVTVHSLARQIQRFALFVTLMRYDDQLQPAPYLARSWLWTPDRRTLEIRMATSLRWHDGRPTSAHDAAFTLDAARDPATGYYRHADLADIESVNVLDDSTLVLRFRRPQPTFPLVLCELPVVPAHRLGGVARGGMRRAPFNAAPVGNGPFRFVEHRPGQRWVFARNDSFPAELGPRPRVARLVIAVVDEATTKFAGLVAGELHLAGVSPTMASLVARDRGLRVLDYPVLMAYGLVFNTHRPPFDDVRVRRAVSLALDRSRLIRAALAGYATEASGPVPGDHPFSIRGDTRRDSVRADSLLDAAGWPRQRDGMRRRGDDALRFELLTVGTADNAVEQLVQADLAAAGIRVEIRQREMSAFLAAARADRKEFDALFTGVPGDLSLAYLSSMFDSGLAGSAIDFGGFHTPRLDTLLAHARRAGADSARRAAWHAVQRDLDRLMPVAWVYHARGLQGVSRQLEGVRMDLRGELATLSEWSLRRPEARIANR